MRAFVINEFGQPGRIEEVAVPEAADGEILVRVQAASVNPMDARVAAGMTRNWAETRLPLIPGLDAAGTVEALGPNSSGFKVGDEVVVSAGTKPFYGAGTFAELVTVPVSAVSHKPAGVDNITAASTPTAGLTAQAAIDALQPGPGQVVVAIGATGGVGSWFTQLAALRGATVVSLAQPDNADYARTMGAHAVVDRTAGDPVDQLKAQFPNGIDAIADFSGNAELLEQLSSLVRKGGMVTSSITKLDADAYTERGLTASQSNRVDLDRLPDLLELLNSGRIKAPEARVMPFADAGSALADIGSGHTRGKIVLQIGS